MQTNGHIILSHAAIKTALATAGKRADDIVEVEVAKCSNIGSNEKTVAAASIVAVVARRFSTFSTHLGKGVSYTKTVQVVPL